MSYEDQVIVCEECGKEFVHSAEDQARYADRGFTNAPKRCRPCREERKAQEAQGDAKTLVCEECGQEFIHSAKDQAYYTERGFTNVPKRCRTCRDKRKARARRGPARSGAAPGRRDRPGGRGYAEGGPRSESYEAVCAECGRTTTVPFKPVQGRPVYCRDCFRAKRR